MTKILYKGILYRVVHSIEEEEVCLAGGWLLTPEEGKEYIVHTAIGATEASPATVESKPRVVPSMDEVLAAGYSREAAEHIIARETRLAAGLSELDYPWIEDPGVGAAYVEWPAITTASDSAPSPEEPKPEVTPAVEPSKSERKRQAAKQKAAAQPTSASPTTV